MTRRSEATERSTPITDLVNLARSYSPEEWKRAGLHAASDTVEYACVYMAQLAATKPPVAREA